MTVTQTDRFNEYRHAVLSQVYSEQEEGNFHNDLIPIMVKRYIDPLNLPKDSRIVDMGCGFGKFMAEMRDRGFSDIVGVTISDHDFGVCVGKGFATKKADMTLTDFEDGEFSFVFCRHALEHSPYPLFTLMDYHRILEKSGLLYVEVPAPGCDRGHENNPNHYSILGPQMWMALFRKAGFREELSDYVEFDLTPEMREKYLVFVLRKG